MKNTDVFTSSGYDMVVAVTQKSINDQLNLLQNPDIGIIPTTLIMQLQWSDDGLTETGKTFQSWDAVEKLHGLPLNQTINAEYTSSIQITESGTVVNLVLTFSKGLFYWMNMSNGHIMPGMDMTGWTWGISVNVDLAGMERDEIAKNTGLTPSVQKLLEGFTTDQFAVSNLYLNLQGTDLAQFNPTLTSTLHAPKMVHDSFVLFISNYLDDLKQDPSKNPYVLGYTIVQTPQTPSTEANVPPTLDPIGTTFTVFHDPTNPDLSTVNFILNTKCSAGTNGFGNHPTPGNFDTNWISPTDQVDGKITYGSINFLETIILEPFYNNYAQKVSSQIGKLVNIRPDNNYEQAKQLGAVGRAADAPGFVYKIHDVPDTNDQYTNTLAVNWSATKTGVSVNLAGNIHTYKYNSVNWGLGNYAEASASMDYAWTSEIDLTLGVDANGTPQITMNNPTLTITNSKQDSWKNDFAKFVDVLGTMLGGFADMFTAFKDGNAATQWFLGWMSPDIHGIGGLNLTLGSISDPAQHSVMLPAGGVFFFKDIALLPEGCLSLGVTYKTPTGQDPPPVSSVTANLGTGSTNPSKNVTHLAAQASPQPSKSVAPGPQSLPAKQSEKLAVAIGDSKSSNLGNPLVDQFSVQQVVTPPPPTPTMIDVTVSCELMSNSKVGMPVSPSTDMIVVQDNKGSPLIFTIGSDQRFYLLLGSSGQSDSGWSTVNLLDTFTGYTTAQTFDVVQDGMGSISLSFAINNSNTGNLDTFFASLLSNDLTVTNFRKLPSMAQMVQGVPSTFTTESIRLGASDDGKRPLLTVEGSLDSKHILYQLDASAKTAQMLELPENITPGPENLLGHCQGFSFGQRANFFLYKIGDTKRLIARSNADASHGSVSFDYGPSALPATFHDLNYNCIQTATSRSGAINTASDLYIGTSKGVYRIPNGKTAAVEQVALIKDVHGIRVTTEGDHISLWITSSPDLLYYVYGQRGTGTTVTWNSSVLFASKVVQVAPMRNISKSSNELFVLDSDQTITHYWQDPTSTSWRFHVSSVPKSNFVVNFNSYTTHVHFQSNSLTFSGQKVLVTSSEWQYCTINGLVYSLDVDVPAEITADTMGNVTIISSAVDISPPVLHLQSPDFAETINIYPNGKILTHLHNVTDGTSLQNARAQDGTKVLPDTTKPENANGIAANISNIHTAAAQNYPPTSSGKTFTSVMHPASPSTSGLKQTLRAKMDVSHLPSGFVAGMVSENGVWKAHTPTSATVHLSTLSLGSAIGDFFGDVWHDIEQAVDEGAIIDAITDTGVILTNGINFIIQKAEEGLEFVLTLVDKVVRIALTTLLEAFKALNFLFKLIGIDLTAILRWLGHLMGWDKIWDTHKLIASTITNFVKFGMDNLSEAIGELKNLIDQGIAKLESEIDNAILPASAKTESITNSQAVQDSNKPEMQSPQANFASYHFNNAALPAGSDPTPTGSSPPLAKVPSDDHNPLTQLVNDVLVPMVSAVLDKLGTDAADLINLIKSGSLDDLRILVVDLIKTVLDPLKTAMDGLLLFVQDLIGDVEALLNDDLEIPVIGAIYEFVTALFGEEEKFSAINGMSFLIAIPVVIVMEIAGLGTPGDHNSMHFDTTEWLSTLKGTVSALPSSLSSSLSAAAATQHPMMLKALDASTSSDADLKNYSAVAGLLGASGAVFQNACDMHPNPVPNFIKTAKRFLTVWTAGFGFPMPIGPIQWTYWFRIAMWGVLNLTSVLTNFVQFEASWTKLAGDEDEVARYKSAFKLLTRFFLAIPCVFTVDFIENKDELTIATDAVSNFGASVAGFGGVLTNKTMRAKVKVSGLLIAEGGAAMSIVNATHKLQLGLGHIAVGAGGH